MDITEFQDYKHYVVQRFQSQQRGSTKEIAAYLGVNSSFVSQVLRGSKDFSLEQAVKLSQFLGLNAFENSYFLTMIQLERAGTAELRNYFLENLNQLRSKHRKISEQLPKTKSLSPQQRAHFYSKWYYSGIRLLTSLKEYQTENSICEYFGLPKSVVREALEFLESCGLITKKSEKYTMAQERTFLSRESPLAVRHSINWRLKAMENFDNATDHELIFTAPLTINKGDVGKVRKILSDAIKQISDVIEKSEPSELMCLNVDWLKIRK